MSFQSSPQTPRTHLILCLMLSAMLLLTFIFLLTLAIITPSWSLSFLHPLPTQLFLWGAPLIGSGFVLWQVPFWVISRWLTLVSLSPTLISCQTQPCTQPAGQENKRKSYLLQNEVTRPSARAVTLNAGTRVIWVWCNWNQMERSEIP